MVAKEEVGRVVASQAVAARAAVEGVVEATATAATAMVVVVVVVYGSGIQRRY